MKWFISTVRLFRSLILKSIIWLAIFPFGHAVPPFCLVLLFNSIYCNRARKYLAYINYIWYYMNIVLVCFYRATC